MVKNDYHVIVCRILAYLYACLKSGAAINIDELLPKRFDIEPSYWFYIIENLQEQGHIKGVYIRRPLNGMSTVKLGGITITPLGIEYLQNNSAIEKAKNFLKTIKEITPGL